jgi:TatD DNase family protein
MEAKRCPLIDTHVHIDELRDLEGAVKRAQFEGIRAIIGVGSDLISNERVLLIARAFPGYIFPALGFHPWQITPDQVDATLEGMDREAERYVAFGEVGLDFKVGIDKGLQIRVFRTILKRAAHWNRPVIIHARGAWEEAFSMVSEAGLVKAVFHWYSGPIRHRKAIKRMPVEGLLLETDAPQEYRGIESEPKDLLTSLLMVANLKGMEPDEVAQRTSKNALELFGLGLTM